MDDEVDRVLDRRAADYVNENMPMIGVGTYQVTSRDVLFKTIDAALGVGYRFIDTAQCYRNEEIIGSMLPELLEKHGLQREDIFITTKVSPMNQGKEKAAASVQKSLRNLRIDYLDLVLIHWPGMNGRMPAHRDNALYRTQTYEELEKLMDAGKVRSIGISNFEVSHVEALLKTARYLPAVNQCECHPHFANKELAEYCQQKGIHFQAYSSLGGPDYFQSLMTDDTVRDIAEDHDTSPAVVLLAWGLHKGYSVLPRTMHEERVVENWKATKMTLEEEEVERLSNIAKKVKACWDPSVIV